MKLVKKIGIISLLSTLALPAFSKDLTFDCLDNTKINYETDFLNESSSLIDTQNFANDFKSGIECYHPATFAKMSYVKSNYTLNEKTFYYENAVNFGEQVFFLNGKIPKNSFLLGHPSIPILLYKSGYLNNTDISDYYISFEQTYSEDKTVNEPLKIIYQSPYNFTRAMIHASSQQDNNNVLFYFNNSDKSDITPLKKSIETYFLDIINKNNLPLKLQNTENLEIMRIYLNGFYNSLNLIEPFLKVFLDHIDTQGFGFKTDLKHSEIDSVFAYKEELNPFTVFGEHVVVSYTFDKNLNSGLIAFSFLSNEKSIKSVQDSFKVNN